MQWGAAVRFRRIGSLPGGAPATDIDVGFPISPATSQSWDRKRGPQVSARDRHRGLWLQLQRSRPTTYLLPEIGISRPFLAFANRDTDPIECFVVTPRMV